MSASLELLPDGIRRTQIGVFKLILRMQCGLFYAIPIQRICLYSQGPTTEAFNHNHERSTTAGLETRPYSIPSFRDSSDSRLRNLITAALSVAFVGFHLPSAAAAVKHSNAQVILFSHLDKISQRIRNHHWHLCLMSALALSLADGDECVRSRVQAAAKGHRGPLLMPEHPGGDKLNDSRCQQRSTDAGSGTWMDSGPDSQA